MQFCLMSYFLLRAAWEKYSENVTVFLFLFLQSFFFISFPSGTDKMKTLKTLGNFCGTT